jgi:hypothetical protein
VSGLSFCFRKHVFATTTIAQGAVPWLWGKVDVETVLGADGGWFRFATAEFGEDGDIDPDAAREWISEHGDPLGLYGQTSRQPLSDWWPYIKAFRDAASHWSPPDADGVRVLMPMAELTRQRLEFMPPPQGRFIGAVEVEVARHVDHMLASCGIHLRDGATFAPCRECGGWFERQHKATVYCSAHCRQRNNFRAYQHRKEGDQ